MKRILSFMALLLLFVGTVWAQKIACVELMAETTGEEQKAKTFFDQYFVNETFETCPQSIGKFINTQQVANNTDGCMDDVSVLWINIDRPDHDKGYSYDASVSLISNATFVSAVKQFVKNGGALLLTKEGVPLAHLIDRMYEPSEKGHGGFANSEGALKQWVINANIGGSHDKSGHPIYAGIGKALTDGNGKEGIAFMRSTSWYTDINTGWNDLLPKGEGMNTADARGNDDPQKLADFEQSWNCVDLGTWGHITDYFGAFIVEFLPGQFNGEEWKGTVLTCGPAAYQWTSENEYLDNIKLFTKNALNYLLDKAVAAQSGSGSEPGGNPSTGDGDKVAHFDMSLSDGKITEQVSTQSYAVSSQLPACTVAGLDGEALRFDGYSNYVTAELPSGLSTNALTVSVTLAAESYPMMKLAANTNEYATICGNLDQTNKNGFAIELSSQGDLQARLYVDYNGGYLMTIPGNQKLPRGQWNNVSLTFDKEGNKVALYLNGVQIGSRNSNKCALRLSNAAFRIGKDATEVKDGQYLLNTFCGAIDDIAITNAATAPESFTPTTADLAYPAERYNGSLWRPQYHAMPSGSWTNESHGMIFSAGKWHVFSQKNPNGPYMYRLHWGHYSSENLYDWKEEPLAILPGETFDKNGCWSGCVYEDGGNTYILYTAIGDGPARIVQARAKDNTLSEWTDKQVVINGQIGLDEDFRDPYFFTANGQKYIIVGGKKNGKGACTLHKWNGTGWTNDGTLFFQSGSAGAQGTFWEMPNVTPMGNGKYLFTVTPQGLGTGVRTIYWVGTIGTDGKFTPDAQQARYLEMGGIGKQGYGLLSPTICQYGDKTLLLGIVPDKLATEENYKMGWAHTMSLVREIKLAADGSLVQKPYSGLTAMRSNTKYSETLTLNGTQSLAPVSGRQIELQGDFTVTSGTCGFRFLSAGTGSSDAAVLTYNVASGALTLDLTGMQRTANDTGTGLYNGVYTASLPTKVTTGGVLKLHVFLDGSVVDIFVGDTWAFSVRLFPKNESAVSAEAFATASTQTTLNAWVLDASQADPTGIETVGTKVADAGNEGCYDLMGRKVTNPTKGVYIMNGRKYICK